MAATALDIVSLNAIKTELRIGRLTDTTRAAFTAHDDILTSQIQAAVSFVAEQIDIPLVDTTEVLCPMTPADSDDPLLLSRRGIKSVPQVRYWEESGALRDDPAGVIVAGNLGRLETPGYRTDRHRRLWPPEDGWPSKLEGTRFQVDTVIGLDIDDKTMALRHAVILCVRQLYDGYREIKPTDAFYALIQPWRFYGRV